jgi:tetratricopeptide (TPR) repeat protein
MACIGVFRGPLEEGGEGIDWEPRNAVDNPSAAPRQASPVGERLDSWKEIASYLKRSVRSVQRWEAEEAMPVHRHLHEKRGTVYAFSSELDAWWKERGSVLAAQNGAAELEPPAAEPPEDEPVKELPPSLSRKPRRVVWATAGFLAAVLAAGLVAWLSRNGSGPAAGKVRTLPFQARDWVLVAGFENRTGEKLFDGTLDYALGRELSNSRYVNVVSRERVADALRLMRRPPTTPIDAALAREVCLRDGDIRALLTGRVEKLGSKYLFSVEIVDPKRSVALAGISEESPGTEGSLAAIRRISDRVRIALGEAPVPGDHERANLAKVTTSSLRALQLYSQADLLMARDGNSAAAEQLLRQAVAEDPTFASAWIHLAWTLFNQHKPLAEIRPCAETALRLSETTTERERFFIRASYFDLLGQREKAITAYEAMLAFYPDHPWAAGNLTSLYRWEDSQQDLRKAVQLEARVADSRPNDFWPNWNAAYNYTVRIPEPARAAPYVRRATELITPERTDLAPNAVTWLTLLPFTEKWLGGELGAAAEEIDRVAAWIDSLGGHARDRAALAAALGYLTLGRLDAAARASEKIADPGVRGHVLVQIAFIKGDALALRQRLRLPGGPQLGGADGTTSETPGAFPLVYPETMSILQARAGLLSEAERFVTAQELLEEEERNLPALHVVRGEIALVHGDLAGAIAEFEEAIKLDDGRGQKRPGPGFYLGSESLAAALAKTGDVPRAIEVLERNPERRDAVIRGTTGAYWLRNQLELAKLYRRASRVAEAQAVEAELANLLSVADRDHPILLDLERLKKS